LLSVLKSAVYVPSSSSDALLSPAVSSADALSAETSDVDVLLSVLDFQPDLFLHFYGFLPNFLN
jgi:hypothetical protein